MAAFRGRVPALEMPVPTPDFLNDMVRASPPFLFCFCCRFCAAYPPGLQDCLPPAEPDATVAIAVPTAAPLPDGIALLTQAVSVSP